MWIPAPVLAISRRHTATPMLSAFVTGGLSSPSTRHSSRLVLRQQLDEVRATLEHDEEAVSGFDRSAALLHEQLPSNDALHRMGTWYVFATADGDIVSGSVTEALDASVTWRQGPAVVPLLRAGLPDPAFVLWLDSEHARFSRLDDETLTLIDEDEADALEGDGHHMGSQHRQGFHQGTHGSTITEEVQRRRKATRERVHTTARRQIQTVLADAGALILTGPETATSQFLRTLPTAIASRTAIVSGLEIASSPTDVIARARTALHAIADRELGHWFVVQRERHQASGRAMFGLAAVENALGFKAVARVAMSRTFAAQHPADAHRVVMRAIADGATATVATLDAVPLLDSHAGGIAAELRFSLPA